MNNVSAPRTKTAPKASSKGSYHKKISTSSHNTLMSKSSTGSSDTEPFYLHPPSIRQSHENIYGAAMRQSSSPPEIYGVPNDGLYINPMRNGALTSPSPNGSVSGESFYLHDPQEVIYNRVKDLFDSDSGGSHKESSNDSTNGGNVGTPNVVVNGSKIHPPNAMTVQVEVHSSSSGAGSGSDESLSVSSGSDDLQQKTRSPLNVSPNANNVVNNNLVEQHDYEDIYLVREEARTTSKAKYAPGRSRSRDSGSHSRSASASSNHSAEIIVQYAANVIKNFLTSFFLNF